MINSYAEYKKCIQQDAIANYRTSCKARFWGDYNWKFILALRRKEYYKNLNSYPQKMLFFPMILVNKYLFQKYSLKCGYTILTGVIEKGLSLPHKGTIVINTTAQIGENCRIHEGVTIGSTNGSRNAARIGNNVFIGSGAKIIGNINIADDVAIGANAVVVKSINEVGTTWAGNPAKKISDNNSHSNLAPGLFL